MHSPPTYDAICNQNTPKKNSRNESNISMKKYHHNPTFGVRSGSSSGVPYVLAMNCHDPVKVYERYNSPDIVTAKPARCVRMNVIDAFSDFERLARWS
jgi:hypothetical protein